MLEKSSMSVRGHHDRDGGWILRKRLSPERTENDDSSFDLRIACKCDLCGRTRLSAYRRGYARRIHRVDERSRASDCEGKGCGLRVRKAVSRLEYKTIGR